MQQKIMLSLSPSRLEHVSRYLERHLGALLKPALRKPLSKRVIRVTVL